MKLDRLEAKTAKPTQEARERGQIAAAHTVRRVEALEGVEADRQRSLQQELAAADPRAAAPFSGQEQVLAAAREVARTITSLGNQRSALIALHSLARSLSRVDEQA